MSEMTITRTPEIIAGEVRHLKAQAQRLILGHAIEIGRRLTEAKAMLEHGQWADWLKNEVSFSQSTANNMMRIFDAYGAAQMGLFGPEANSETFGNLEYSKALALLAVPEEEREAFAEEVDAEHISVRELKAAIKERDEARNQAKGWEEKYNLSREAAEQAKADAEHARESLTEKEKALTLANHRLESLNAEVTQLRERPVDVAVEQVDATGEQLAQAEEKGRKAAESKAEEELKKIDAAWRENYDLLKGKLDEAERALKKVQGVDLLDVKINMVFQRVQELQYEILELADQAEPGKQERIKAALVQGFRTMLERMEVASDANES